MSKPSSSPRTGPGGFSPAVLTVIGVVVGMVVAVGMFFLFTLSSGSTVSEPAVVTSVSAVPS